MSRHPFLATFVLVGMFFVGLIGGVVASESEIDRRPVAETLPLPLKQVADKSNASGNATDNPISNSTTTEVTSATTMMPFNVTTPGPSTLHSNSTSNSTTIAPTPATTTATSTTPTTSVLPANSTTMLPANSTTMAPTPKTTPITISTEFYGVSTEKLQSLQELLKGVTGNIRIFFAGLEYPIDCRGNFSNFVNVTYDSSITEVLQCGLPYTATFVWEVSKPLPVPTTPSPPAPRPSSTYKIWLFLFVSICLIICFICICTIGAKTNWACCDVTGTYFAVQRSNLRTWYRNRNSDRDPVDPSLIQLTTFHRDDPIRHPEHPGLIHEYEMF